MDLLKSKTNTYSKIIHKRILGKFSYGVYIFEDHKNTWVVFASIFSLKYIDIFIPKIFCFTSVILNVLKCPCYELGSF